MKNPSMVHIVDDDEAIRDSISTLFGVAGLNCKLYSNAEEFIEDYTPDRFEAECLLLDLQMPGMGGLGLLKYLQDNEIRVPTIILTGHGEAMDVLSSFQNEVTSFIQKPFQSNELITIVHKILAGES